MLFLTCGPYALLRFPQFCLPRNPCVWICLRGAYAKSLDKVLCTNMQRELTHEAFSITMLQHQAFFSLRNAAHGAGLHISSKHSRFFQLMGQQFVSSILFLQLTEGVDAFVLWCYTGIEGQYFPLHGFLFGRHCGQMTGQMVKETVGPYACLTHALRIPYANH